MRLSSYEHEPRAHPGNGEGYFDFLNPEEMTALQHPVPGYLHVFVYADGTLNERHYRTSAKTSLTTGTEHSAPPCRYSRGFLRLQPVYHEPGCDSCGYRITRTLEDMAGELHHQAETGMLGFEHGIEGRPVASAVIAVHGSGWAGHADQGHALRVDSITLTGPAWLARSTNGQPVPESLPGLLADRYGLTVEWVPSIHELPGTARRTPPVLSGEGYHPSGRYGRYGGAGVLLRSGDYYLLGQRSLIAKGAPGTWTPPGGNRTRHDSDPWDDALLELDEEVRIRPLGVTRHGSVTYQGEGGWTFETFAATLDHHHEPGVNRHALMDAGWFTAEKMGALPLMPEFAQVLPELLALFPVA